MKQVIHANATLTASGSSSVFSAPDESDVFLLVNVVNAPTGTTPQLVFTVSEIDPGNSTTVLSSSVGTRLTSSGTSKTSLKGLRSSLVKISWTVSGAGASFTGVYATLVGKTSITDVGLPERTSVAVPAYVATAATTVVAVRGTAYTEQTTGAQRSIKSNNAADAAAGTGLRTVLLTYYKSDLTGPFTETLALDGTNPINTVATDICFIESMLGLTVGSTGSNVGIITLNASTGGLGAVIGTIAATDGQTFWAHHYIPSGKTMTLRSMTLGSDSGVTGNFWGGSVDPTAAAMFAKKITRIFTMGDNKTASQSHYFSNLKVVGPARFTMFVAPDAGGGTNFRGGFEYSEI